MLKSIPILYIGGPAHGSVIPMDIHEVIQSPGIIVASQESPDSDPEFHSYSLSAVTNAKTERMVIIAASVDAKPEEIPDKVGAFLKDHPDHTTHSAMDIATSFTAAKLSASFASGKETKDDEECDCDKCQAERANEHVAKTALDVSVDQYRERLRKFGENIANQNPKSN